jgi:hypothetical protein
MIAKRIRQLGGHVTFRGNLVFNLGVKLGQTRPMHTWTIVMRRVIPEVTRRDVVDAVNDVVTRDEMRIGAVSRVMTMRRVHRSEERNQHRRDEHEQPRKRPPIGQTRHERDDKKRRKQQHTLMPWILMAHFPRPWIRLKRVPYRVFEPAHRTAIIVLPARFVLGLVEVIHVVPKRMVQHPRITRDARLQRIHLLEQTVEPRRFECRDVLMMMIECANASFGEDADERPPDERPYIVNECIGQQIATEHQRKTEDWQSVLSISKDTHECLVDKRSIFDRNV